MCAYDLTGRVVLITGATDGLGRLVAADAAQAGATVLVHGRNEKRIADTVAELRALTDGERVRSYRADLSSLAEVSALADEVLAGEPRIHVLVNNAGVGSHVPGGGERQESVDGLELRFAVNYLAPYLLTNRLLDLLRSSSPARIVNVSSAGQRAVNFDDPMLEQSYDGMTAYCQSKLAQIIFTFDLGERVAGTGITATALHPSTFMPTKISSGDPISTIRDGADATMRLVADPELEGITARYYRVNEEARADDQAYDPRARRRLHELSERLIAATG